MEKKQTTWPPERDGLILIANLAVDVAMIAGEGMEMSQSLETVRRLAMAAGYEIPVGVYSLLALDVLKAAQRVRQLTQSGLEPVLSGPTQEARDKYAKLGAGSALECLRTLLAESYVDFVFDQMPGPDSCKLIEVERSDGASVRVGEWVNRDDGNVSLRVHYKEMKQC